MTRSAGVASLARTDVRSQALYKLPQLLHETILHAVPGHRRRVYDTEEIDGVIAEGLGNHAAVEQADAALADKSDLVDLHVNHLPM